MRGSAAPWRIHLLASGVTVDLPVHVARTIGVCADGGSI
jgi:hypothetical protein